MLFSQRKVLYLFIFTSLLLSACIPATPPSSPLESVANNSGNVDAVVRAKCRRAGYEAFLAENGEYCFAHPLGYYQDVASKSDAVMLRSNDDLFSLVSASEGLDGVFLNSPEPVVLQIHYEPIKGEDTLLAFASRDQQNQPPHDFIPWFLGHEDAWLVKAIDNSSISYITYAQHGNYYYTLSFNSLVSSPDTSVSATKLEKLFFAVSGSFTFLR